jgi:hypothetical protein
MAWGIPQNSKEEIDAAGHALVSGMASQQEFDAALDVINNWRYAHYHPLYIIQRRLRGKLQETDPNGLVAQRIKRLSSIGLKLNRFPNMRLSQMQDIGGCRAILSSMDELKKLTDIYALRDKGTRSSRGIKHKKINEKDYVITPKESGYRGVHMIFRYYSDKIHDWDGMRIEIQFRTYLQHAWATSVETVGTFIGQALKSSVGGQDWLRFFALASSVIAIEEGSSPIPGTPDSKTDLIEELKKFKDELNVESHLLTYGSALQMVGQRELRGAQYFLLELHPDSHSINVRSYRKNDLDRASEDYLAVERRILNQNADAVLVSADSIAALKRAYPNYFADTRLFVEAINRAIGSSSNATEQLSLLLQPVSR